MRLGRRQSIPLRLFPPHTRPLWRRLNMGLTIWVIVLAVTLALAAGVRRVSSVVDTVAQRHSINLATRLMHEAVNEKLLELGYGYNDLIALQTGPDGQVQSLSVQPDAVGRLKAEVALAVEEKVAAVTETSVQVPYAAFICDDFSVGSGPRVDLVLSPTGYCLVDFENSFTAVGINQTKHQIDIVIEANFTMLTAFAGKGVTVKTTMPVAQTVIVGTVPESYFQIQQ